jgi:phosphate acetyltransferase
VVPDPDARQLADIARASVEARRRIVGDEPRVAFLSYSTRGSADGPSVDKVREALALFREAEPDVIVDGELQVDAALIPAIAASKAPDGVLGGGPTCWSSRTWTRATSPTSWSSDWPAPRPSVPVLQGLAKPCNDLSRGASAADIVAVASLTRLQAADGS